MPRGSPSRRCGLRSDLMKPTGVTSAREPRRRGPDEGTSPPRFRRASWTVAFGLTLATRPARRWRRSFGRGSRTGRSTASTGSGPRCRAPLLTLDLPGFREANRRRTKSLHARCASCTSSSPRPVRSSSPRRGWRPLRPGTIPASPARRRGGRLHEGLPARAPEALVKSRRLRAGRERPGGCGDARRRDAPRSGRRRVGPEGRLRWTIGSRSVRAGRHAGPDARKGIGLRCHGCSRRHHERIVADLAAASGGTFWLLDLVAEPRRDDPKIALFRTTGRGLKRLSSRRRRRVARSRRRSSSTGLSSRRAVGRRPRGPSSRSKPPGTALWRSANLLDVARCRPSSRDPRPPRPDRRPRPRGGSRSRRSSRQGPGEFDLVFDIKADGFFSLLKAAEGCRSGDRLFSSSRTFRKQRSDRLQRGQRAPLLPLLVAARPPRRDAHDSSTGRPGAHRDGDARLDPEDHGGGGDRHASPEAGFRRSGASWSSGFSGEIVVAGRLGLLGAEWDATGGLDAASERLSWHARPVRLGRKGDGRDALRRPFAETALDPKAQPSLRPRPRRRPSPGVMGTETFAEMASLLCPVQRGRRETRSSSAVQVLPDAALEFHLAAGDARGTETFSSI